jgi:hypothetical protein
LNTRITVFGVVLIGLWLTAIASSLIPVPAGTLHAPRWLLGAIGAVFVLGGLLAATTSGGRIATAVAAALLTLLGAAGGWVAAGGSAAVGASVAAFGAAPAPPAARIACGIGAVLVLAWAAYAWRQVFKLRQ